MINNLDYHNVDHVYDIANTGDLIYFRWHEVDLLQEIITHFTHIGIVMVDPISGNKYIIETHLKGDGEDLGNTDGGVQKYNLKERLSKYKGTTFLSKLKYNIPNYKTTHEFMSNLNNYKQNIPFHDDYKGYFLENCLLNRVCKNCFKIKEKDGLFCSEFIGFCLKELRILSDDFNHKCLAPGDFRFILNDNKEYLFDKLIKIKNNN